MGWIHSGGVWSILLYIEGGRPVAGGQPITWRNQQNWTTYGELTPPPRPTHTHTHTCTSLNCTETETIFMFEGF